MVMYREVFKSVKLCNTVNYVVNAKNCMQIKNQLYTQKFHLLIRIFSVVHIFKLHFIK